MTYQLRDRPDGQIEIVVLRPETVGTFADRAIAAKVLTFLQEEEAFAPAEAGVEPRGLFGANLDAEAATVVEDVLKDLAPPAPPRGAASSAPASGRQRRSGQPADAATQLPAVVRDQPRPPVPVKVRLPASLSEDQRDAAFARLAAGEKTAAVASDFGLGMAQLRAIWSHHKRQLQPMMAGAGREKCRLCQAEFTPSLSHPDTCARCSRECTP